MGIIQRFRNMVESSSAADTLRRGQDFLSNMRQRTQGYAGAARTYVSNGAAFIGLNYQQVPAIREAIRQYVQRIQEAAAYLNESANAEQAVRGEIVQATQQYLQAVQVCLDAYVSKLLVYSDQMQTHYENYAANDTTLSSNVTEDISSLQSEADAERYTETL